VSGATDVHATGAHIFAACGRRKSGTSAVEAVHSGGTCIPMRSAAGTGIIAMPQGSKVIARPPERTPIRLNRQ
jgi:hypothetical protein